MTSLNIQIPLETLPASNLRLQFDKSSDRWSHRWQLVDEDGQATDVLTSVEGGAEDIFRRQLQCKKSVCMNCQPVLRCWELAWQAKGHWSASYSVETREDQHSIKCDLACLLKQLQSDGQWLGSTYSVGDGVKVETEGLKVRFSMNGQSFSLIADPAYASIETAEQQIQIVPTKLSDSKTVATRWLFSVA